MRAFLPCLLALLLAPLPAAQEPSWSLAEAEHLLNRAGFGGPTSQVRELAARGRAAAVDALVDAALEAPVPTYPARVLGRPSRRDLAGLDREERRARLRRHRRADRRQAADFRAWWMDLMVEGPAPLREKMVLFWHGYFTSSYRDVRNSYHMILQNGLFREHALGSFRLLLHAVSRDPAMLAYLDNNRNRKGRPNENFAREVMELFTLGPGNYNEQDIKEAARAFTGWTFRGNSFVEVPRRHDAGVKTVLGRKGRLKGGDVLDVLLEQEACARHVAGRLLEFFVGSELPAGMLERYAGLLKRGNWELAPVLRTLFKDPDFYSPGVMGTRILGPVEFVVGVSRRRGAEPPGSLLASTAAMLGQSLLDPPDVKGWEGGTSWITTSTLLARANVAEYLTVGVSPRRVRRDYDPEQGMSMQAARRAAPMRMIFRGVRRGERRWAPETPLPQLPEVVTADSATELVEQLCERFLAVPPSPAALEALEAWLQGAEEPPRGSFRVPGPRRLNRLVNLILSLPEAQLG